MALINLFLASALLFLQGALVYAGTTNELIVCEELPVGICSFAISSSGNRCLLETTYASSSDEDGRSTTELLLQCRTSPVAVLMNDHLREHMIESDACIRACGLDRNSVGISSDALLDLSFVSKICSSACSDNCPNILDLYHNLAAAEGVSLPELCKAVRTSPRRAMVQLLSSGGAAASGPSSAVSGVAEGPCTDAAYPPTASEP